MADRQHVGQWNDKLLALAKAVKADTPADELRRLHALDVAMIESAVYGLLAQYGRRGAVHVIQSTLASILESEDDRDHWRNREGSDAPTSSI